MNHPSLINNFQSTVDSRYGAGTRNKIRALEKLKIKFAKETNHVTYLTKCKREGLTPKGLSLKTPYLSLRSKNIIESANKKLVQDRLNFHLGNKERLRSKIDTETSNLSQILGPDFKNIIASLEKSADKQNSKSKETHKKKLDQLRSKTNKNARYKPSMPEPAALSLPTSDQGSGDLAGRKTDNAGDGTVINLSDRTLDESETNILSKGLNFAITPKSINVLDFITGIESATPQLSEEEADQFRSEASLTLKKIKPIKSNTSRNETHSINNLKTDDTIKILPSDKGNATVILNKKDYDTKIEDVLKLGKYTLLKKDPTKSLETKIANTLRKHKKYFSEKQRTKLTPHHSKTPHIYGLPKIHKQGIPLRPIVSSKNSPSRQLCNYLLPILKPISGNTNSHVINTKHFVEMTKDIQISKDDILVSFDVESLFTNIPVQETLNIIDERLTNDPTLKERTKLPTQVIMELLNLCTEANYFELKGKIYRQDEGMAMGSPLSPIFANIFMEEFERRAIDSSVLRPEVWLRYVDDTFVVWSHGADKLEDFTKHLNNISPTIKLTVEKETNKQLPFLDVNVTRDGNALATAVYRKKTHTGRYLNFDSNHSRSVKEGVAYSLYDRAKTVCTDKHSLNTEIRNIDNDLKKNGYPSTFINKCKKPRPHKAQKNSENNKPAAFISIPYVPKLSEKIRRIARKYKIQTAFRTQNTLRQHLCKTRPKNEEQASKNSVYSIKCECNREYIGETKRPLHVRIKEHKNNTLKGNTANSKIAKHAWDNEHKFSWNEAKILQTEPHYYKRKFIEGALIKINSDPISQSSVEVRPLWLPLLKQHFKTKKTNTLGQTKNTSPENTKTQSQRNHHMTLRGMLT